MDLKAYRRFFIAARWMGRNIRSMSVFLLAARFALPWLHPQRGDKSSWLRYFHQQARKDPQVPRMGSARHARERWNAYLADSCLATAVMHRPDKLDHIRFTFSPGSQACFDEMRQLGGMLITYHTHFAYHFCVFMGRVGLPLSVVTASPRMSAFADLFEEFGAQWFKECESYYNGGEWIFTEADGSFRLRSVVSNLDQGGLVITANDLNNFYTGSGCDEVQMRGLTFQPPNGLVNLALRREKPLYAGWLTWSSGGMVVDLRRLDNGRPGTQDSQAILSQYFSHLDALIGARPDFWDGWRTFPMPPEQAS